MVTKPFEGVLAIAKEGEPTIEAFAGYLHNMANIETFKKIETKVSL